MSNDMERERPAFEAAWLSGAIVSEHTVEGESQHDLLKRVAWHSWQAARATPAPAEAQAWMTHHDVPMLFPTEAEAASYCDDDERPIPLFAAPPTAGAEREGWQWVPVQPTDRMMDHFAGTKYSELPPGKRVNEQKAYRAMLAAAPSAPSDQQGGRNG